MNHIKHVIEGLNPMWAMMSSVIMYVAFPQKAFLIGFVCVLVAIFLDTVTKYIALAKNNGGMFNALKTGAIRSRHAWSGVKIKLLDLAIVSLISGLAYRIVMVDSVTTIFGIVAYNFMFWKEIQSCIENRIEAGSQLNWFLVLVKRKQKELMNISETDTATKKDNSNDLGC